VGAWREKCWRLSALAEQMRRRRRHVIKRAAIAPKQSLSTAVTKGEGLRAALEPIE
jgi:predicted transcriptional regulator